MTTVWPVCVALHNVVHVPASVCRASPRCRFVLELQPRHALTAQATPTPTATFAAADVVATSPGVYEVTLDGTAVNNNNNNNDNNSNNNNNDDNNNNNNVVSGSKHKARRAQRRNSATHARVWRCTAPSIEVCVRVTQQLLRDDNNDDDNDDAAKVVAAVVVGRSPYVTLRVRAVLQRDKLYTCFVTTPLGFVGVSCRVDAGDCDGYTTRLRQFLSRWHPAALRVVARVVDAVPELETFMRLHRSYGVGNIAARVRELVAYYGTTDGSSIGDGDEASRPVGARDNNHDKDKHSNRERACLHTSPYAREVAQLLAQWRDREAELLHRLVLDNGPEPRDVDVHARVCAFVAHYHHVLRDVDVVDVQRLLSLAQATSSPHASTLLVTSRNSNGGSSDDDDDDDSRRCRGAEAAVSALFARLRARYGPEPHPFTYLQPSPHYDADALLHQLLQQQQQQQQRRQRTSDRDSRCSSSNSSSSGSRRRRGVFSVSPTPAPRTRSPPRPTRASPIRIVDVTCATPDNNNNNNDNNKVDASPAPAVVLMSPATTKATTTTPTAPPVSAAATTTTATATATTTQPQPARRRVDATVMTDACATGDAATLWARMCRLLQQQQQQCAATMATSATRRRRRGRWWCESDVFFCTSDDFAAQLRTLRLPSRDTHDDNNDNDDDDVAACASSRAFTARECDVLMLEWRRRVQDALREEALPRDSVAAAAAVRELCALCGVAPLQLRVLCLTAVWHALHHASFVARLHVSSSSSSSSSSDDDDARAATAALHTERLLLVGDYAALQMAVRYGVTALPPSLRLRSVTRRRRCHSNSNSDKSDAALTSSSPPCVCFVRTPFARVRVHCTTALLVCDVLVAPRHRRRKQQHDDDHDTDNDDINNDNVDDEDDVVLVDSPMHVLPRLLAQCIVDTTATPCATHPHRVAEYVVCATNTLACSACVVHDRHRTVDTSAATDTTNADAAVLPLREAAARVGAQRATARADARALCDAAATLLAQLRGNSSGDDGDVDDAMAVARRRRRAHADAAAAALREAAERRVAALYDRVARAEAVARARHDAQCADARALMTAARRVLAQLTDDDNDTNNNDAAATARTTMTMAASDDDVDVLPPPEQLPQLLQQTRQAQRTLAALQRRVHAQQLRIAQHDDGDADDTTGDDLAAVAHTQHSDDDDSDCALRDVATTTRPSLPAPPRRQDRAAAATTATTQPPRVPVRPRDAHVVHTPHDALLQRTSSSSSSLLSPVRTRVVESLDKSTHACTTTTAATTTTTTTEAAAAEAALQRGWHALRRGDVHGARQAWQRVCDVYGSDSVYARKAHVYMCEAVDTDYHAAARAYTRYLQRAPHDAAMRYRYALLLEAALGRRAEARQQYERAAALGDEAAATRVEQLRKGV